MFHYVLLLSIPFSVKALWDAWNIRVGVLLSLFWQMVLIFVAPIRKSSRNGIVNFMIWIAYLLADNTAIFVIGLISNSYRNRSRCPELKPPESSDLLAFWAPFLLLHLGGPDTITAFALEDNQLWLRHFLILNFQVGAVIYIFFQSIHSNNLLVPTILMFMAGTIKYAERTVALYCASLDKFRESILKDPDPGPNYAKLMEEYASNKSKGIPTRISIPPDPAGKKAEDSEQSNISTTPIQVMRDAYNYFKIFRGLVVDLIFSLREGDKSSDYFQRMYAEDAFYMIEVELNFIYGSFYTKDEIVHVRLGMIFRFISSGLILATLGLFHFQSKRDEIHRIDIIISYVLLICGIILDTIAFLMFGFSDRRLASFYNLEKSYYFGPIIYIFNWFHAFRKPRLINCTCAIGHNVLATPSVLRRWSESISAYSLISYCLESNPCTIHEYPTWREIMFKKASSLQTTDYKGEKKVGHWCHCLLRRLSSTKRKNNFVFKYIIKPIKELLDEIVYVSHEPITKELWQFIFDELKIKSKAASEAIDSLKTARDMCAARGEKVLNSVLKNGSKHSTFLKYVNDVQYDESLLLWHVATDLCFYTEKIEVLEETFKPIKKAKESEEETNENTKPEFEDLKPLAEAKRKLSQRQFSKILSDYMLFLLIYQPNMMSSVGGIGKIRFRDTCAEAERFFQKLSLLDDEKIKIACDEVLSVDTEVEPVIIKGDRSKSVLFNASMLAKELKSMEFDKRWELLSKMWVELLSYAATHVKASTHAEQLSKGGQLIAFVWMLMAHFGLGEQFQIGGHGKAKLIVEE